ncbi:LytR/AlgR family response regulator transcription factor [Lactococcus ileimucosae]|uniref:LytR/AlgR family response regulator transcription factor n=1 Tax=Lactococcus ileimucosae TaxID=2941329 RepID=UPI002042D4C7|nr:LytTR family DNA-binding domain-containing protein [Lactococcus ileimucosae]
MLRIAVCDDDFVVCDKVEQLIQDYDSTAIVDVYHTPQRLINHLVDENYDLYILDIEFPEASGLLIAKEIRRFDVDVPIVFLTSFEQYAMTVFKLHTFDYVLKPVSQDKIFSLLNRIKKYLDIDNNVKHQIKRTVKKQINVQ